MLCLPSFEIFEDNYRGREPVSCHNPHWISESLLVLYLCTHFQLPTPSSVPSPHLLPRYFHEKLWARDPEPALGTIPPSFYSLPGRHFGQNPVASWQNGKIGEVRICLSVRFLGILVRIFAFHALPPYIFDLIRETPPLGFRGIEKRSPLKYFRF